MSEQLNSGRTKRLYILNSNEIAALYNRPRFSNDDRRAYFALTGEELAVLPTLHTFESRIWFILQLGYFKATQQFFIFGGDDVSDDIAWICNTYYPVIEYPLKPIGKKTRLKQQRLILELMSYRLCGEPERNSLHAHAKRAVRISSRPRAVLRQLRHYLTEPKSRRTWVHSFAKYDQ